VKRDVRNSGGVPDTLVDFPHRTQYQADVDEVSCDLATCINTWRRRKEDCLGMIKENVNRIEMFIFVFMPSCPYP